MVAFHASAVDGGIVRNGAKCDLPILATRVIYISCHRSGVAPYKAIGRESKHGPMHIIAEMTRRLYYWPRNVRLSEGMEDTSLSSQRVESPRQRRELRSGTPT